MSIHNIVRSGCRKDRLLRVTLLSVNFANDASAALGIYKARKESTKAARKDSSSNAMLLDWMNLTLATWFRFIRSAAVDFVGQHVLLDRMRLRRIFAFASLLTLQKV
jgi:hypothetical protein